MVDTYSDLTVICQVDVDYYDMGEGGVLHLHSDLTLICQVDAGYYEGGLLL